MCAFSLFLYIYKRNIADEYTEMIVNRLITLNRAVKSWRHRSLVVGHVADSAAFVQGSESRHLPIELPSTAPPVNRPRTPLYTAGRTSSQV